MVAPISKRQQGTKVLVRGLQQTNNHIGEKSRIEIASQKREKSVYLLGRANTFAEVVESVSVPPTISGPRGVKAIPRLSARASGVSSESVSQRLPRTSKVNVTDEMSIGFPSAVTSL